MRRPNHNCHRQVQGEEKARHRQACPAGHDVKLSHRTAVAKTCGCVGLDGQQDNGQERQRDDQGGGRRQVWEENDAGLWKRPDDDLFVWTPPCVLLVSSHQG